MPDPEWSKCTSVESIPGKLSGAWVLRGTRMPVSAVLENLEGSATLDEIMEWFDGLDRKQVEDVIQFARVPLSRPFTQPECLSSSIRQHLCRSAPTSKDTSYGTAAQQGWSH